MPVIRNYSKVVTEFISFAVHVGQILSTFPLKKTHSKTLL